MKRRIIIVAVSAICLVARIVFGQGQYGNPTNASLAFAPKLPSSGADWKAEAARLTGGRARLVGDVLQRLVSESNPEKKASLVFLLGEYRAPEAAAVLAGMISFEARDSSESDDLKRPPLWGKYPAYEALVKIGASSIPAVIAKLEIETDATAKSLEASVLRAVFGRDMAEQALGIASANQVDAKKKANLEAAREIVRTGREP